MVTTNSVNEFTDFLNRSVDKKEITNDYLKNLSVWLRTKEHSLHVAETPDALEVSYSLLKQSMSDNGMTFIDLKQYFKNSSKAKPTKNGGWYLVVPVGGIHKVSDYRDVYGRNTWDKEISKMNMGQTFSSADKSLPQRLQSRIQGGTGNVIPELTYNWKSSSITREQWGSSGKRARYLTFRTVSNKSDPMSWIVGRQNLSQQIKANNSHNERQLGSYIAEVINAYVSEYNSEKGD